MHYHIYFKDSFKLKYQYLIKKREHVIIKDLKDSKVFIEYSDNIKDVYSSIEEYHPGKERKLLIVFDDMIANMITTKKDHPAVNNLFVKGRKLHTSVVVSTQPYFHVPKVR